MSFFVTTPIYYVNDQPHIGHAYTSLAADILARHHRMRGRKVFFLTGTDEHGQKVARAAQERDRSPKEHADLMVGNFKSLWKRLGLSNDAFIRTTDEGHRAVVRDLLQRLWEKGEIVRRTYAGFYCTPCERFWTEKDLREGNCPDCLREVELIEEDNYFFLMSKYKGALLGHIEKYPRYILPETRKNEVLGFLRTNPLGDLCISRPAHRLSWGIPLPFDEGYVTYVWFDALINYYSATRYLAPPGMAASGDPFETGLFAPWPADCHIIGKDILTTHAVYWSTMLMALGMPLPGTIFAHGWWTVEGRKMSKSLGNVVDPAQVASRFGNDAFRYFLFREVPFGLDGNFSEDAIVGRINTDLANDLGNLASRTFKMAARYFGSKAPEPEEEEAGMKALAETVLAEVERHIALLQFNRCLEEIWRLVSFANKYIDSNAPWALARDREKEGRLRTVIYSSLEALRVLSLYLSPYLPEAADRLSVALGQGKAGGHMLPEAASWGLLEPGTVLSALDPLFPRIEAGGPPEGTSAKGKEEGQMDEALVSIEDFSRLRLRTAKVLAAERVKGSEKLLRLEVEVDAGSAPRQIVAGIGKAYSPEELLGKTIVVVANLKPARLMGVESQGMLLAATGPDGSPSIVSPDREIPPGSAIK